MIFHGKNVVENFVANSEQEEKESKLKKVCNFLKKNQNDDGNKG